MPVPALSYAERAKGVKPGLQARPQAQSTAPTPSNPPPPTASSIASTSSTATTSTLQPQSHGPKAAQQPRAQPATANASVSTSAQTSSTIPSKASTSTVVTTSDVHPKPPMQVTHAPLSSPTPPVNVWALRAARRAAPPSSSLEVSSPVPPPPPPPRDDEDAFVVRQPQADPWPSIGRSNSVHSHSQEPESHLVSQRSSPVRHQIQMASEQSTTPPNQTHIQSRPATPPQKTTASNKKATQPTQNTTATSTSVAAPDTFTASYKPNMLAGQSSPGSSTIAANPVSAIHAPAESTSVSAIGSSGVASPEHISSGAASPKSRALSPMPGFSSVPTPAFSPSGAASPVQGVRSSPSSAAWMVSTPADSGAGSPVKFSPESPPRSSLSEDTSVKAEINGSGGASANPVESASSRASKTRARKWVAIPPEELRAAAEQQQRSSGNGGGGYVRDRDGYGRNGYMRSEERAGGFSGGGYRGRNGRKSQSQSQNVSGTTSRAESVASAGHEREHDYGQQERPQQQGQAQQQPERKHDQQYSQSVQQDEYAPQQQQQLWGYLPSHPQAHMYQSPPHMQPPQYYGQPYAYDPVPYGYWGQPDARGTESQEDDVSAKDSGLPKHNHYRHGWRPAPLFWWMPPQQAEAPHQLQAGTSQPRQVEQEQPGKEQSDCPPEREATLHERPPPPAESDAVAVSSSLSSLPRDGAVVFGSVDGGLASLGVPSSVDQLPQSMSAAAIGNVSSPPPPSIPASVSAPARESEWRATEPVWPADPWGAKATSTAVPSTTGTNPRAVVFAIGVSPRSRETRLADDPGLEVVDFTVPPGTLGGRWEFGTTREADRPAVSGNGYPYPVYGGGYGYDGQPMYDTYPPPVDGPPSHPGGMIPMGMTAGAPLPPMMGVGAYGMPPPQMQGALPSDNGVGPVDPSPSDADASVNGIASGSGSANVDGRRGDGSEWDVGYNIGGGYAGSRDEPAGNAYVPRAPHEQHPPQQDDRTARDMEYPAGRPRRGSYNGGPYGYESRGGYGNRRGRGGFRGYGRYGRGGFQHQVRPQPPVQQQPPPFTLTPPPNFIPLVPDGHYTAPYMPTSYDYSQTQYQAPAPTLRTRLSFPIDRLRHEILSQLEFYLSPDNMATDFYLRQQMDSRGWVRIDVLASFKRVQSKTMDVNLVRDVLQLSDYAEIRGDWVRSTDGWEKFVLPTAKLSVVEAETPQSLLLQADKPGHAAIDDAEDVDDEDEEDVVFVMGRDAHHAWSPERPR